MSGIDLHTVLYVASIVAIPGVLAITVHEVAHGWVAKYCGDPTAHLAGRLTLNPIKHIDPLGTLIVPAAFLLATGGAVPFGWAKPVPVDPKQLRRPRRNMIAIAVAGPISNLLMAAIWTVVGALSIATLGYETPAGAWLAGVVVFGIQINVILAAFNLLPIPPLDGGRVVLALLPPRIAAPIERFELFGLIIVVVLILAGPLRAVMEPAYLRLNDFFQSLTGLA